MMPLPLPLPKNTPVHRVHCHLMNLLEGPDMKNEPLWDFLQYVMENQEVREIVLFVDGLDALDLQEQIVFARQICWLRNMLRAINVLCSCRILVTTRRSEVVSDFFVELPRIDEDVALSGTFKLD
jgi:hypothetical protein